MPTPHDEIPAPCSFRLVTRCSSSSLLATIRASGKPPASSDLRASADSQARSPESRRTPSISCPRSRSSFPTCMACRTPSRESYVSARRTTLLGSASAYARKAASSSSNAITQLCPCVPLTGIPNSRPARTLEVAAQPPIHAARLAESAPSNPCARRSPNSSTGSPRAAITTRAALVATSDWKLIALSTADSTSWHCRMGPATRSIGSSGNTTVPSGTASTSQEKRSAPRCSRKPGSKSGAPSLPRTRPR